MRGSDESLWAGQVRALSLGGDLGFGAILVRLWRFWLDFGNSVKLGGQLMVSFCGAGTSGRFGRRRVRLRGVRYVVQERCFGGVWGRIFGGMDGFKW